MKRMIGPGLFFALATLPTAEPAAAQDLVAGAIAGDAVGASSAVRSAAAQARRGRRDRRGDRRASAAAGGGYYWWRGRCHVRYPNGNLLQVQPGYCR